MTTTKMLAFEIGTEEIPAFDLAQAVKQVDVLVTKACEEARIGFDKVEVYSSPRRLIALVHGVAQETEALVEEHKGPSAAIAFDDDGNPSKAAIGFARGKGLDVTDLERRNIGGVEYVYALKNIPAMSVKDLLPDLLVGVIEDISWPKSCRWGTRSEYFSRPVRWLVALFGEDVIPVRFAGLEASNKTFGHRFLSPGVHEVPSADKLIEVLEKAFVVSSEKAREQVILSGIKTIESQVGALAEIPEKTLLEVINLTEYPTPLMGSFDKEFLEVPEEIIVDAMLVHQRYFPLYDQDRRLTNNFIAVSNGDPACASIIIDGNERVVRPRLSDAKFFYEEDLKQPLESYVEKLDAVVFQESLGTMRAKTERLGVLAQHLAADANLTVEETRDVERAVYLCKADLVTNAVVEFTSVQGIMGAYYAQAAGENEQVVSAIREHYRPRFSGDASPGSVVGKLVAFADKLDTIVGLFAVGQGPTGSSDPFALRRSAIGIIHMILEGLPVSLSCALDASLMTFEDLSFDKEATRVEVLDFFVTRTKVMLRDEGLPADVVDAVLAAKVTEPLEITTRVHALEQARETMNETMNDLATAYARAHNLTDENLGQEVHEALMGDAEKALFAAIEQVELEVMQNLTAQSYTGALKALAALRAPIDRFFEDVLIMDKDEALKENRLKLLNRFVAVFDPVADFGKLAKMGK